MAEEKKELRKIVCAGCGFALMDANESMFCPKCGTKYAPECQQVTVVAAEIVKPKGTKLSEEEKKAAKEAIKAQMEEYKDLIGPLIKDFVGDPQATERRLGELTEEIRFVRKQIMALLKQNEMIWKALTEEEK